MSLDTVLALKQAMVLESQQDSTGFSIGFCGLNYTLSDEEFSLKYQQEVLDRETAKEGVKKIEDNLIDSVDNFSDEAKQALLLKLTGVSSVGSTPETVNVVEE